MKLIYVWLLFQPQAHLLHTICTLCPIRLVGRPCVTTSDSMDPLITESPVFAAKYQAADQCTTLRSHQILICLLDQIPDLAVGLEVVP